MAEGRRGGRYGGGGAPPPPPRRPGRPAPGVPGQLVTGEQEQVGEAEPEGLGGGREHLGGCLLASALHLRQVRHRDPGRLRDVLQRAFLGEPLAPQHVADEVAPQRLPRRAWLWTPYGSPRGVGRATGTGRGGLRAQGVEAGLVRRMSGHPLTLGIRGAGGRECPSALGEAAPGPGATRVRRWSVSATPGRDRSPSAVATTASTRRTTPAWSRTSRASSSTAGCRPRTPGARASR